VGIAELTALLQEHGVNVASLALTLSRGHERIYELAVPPHEMLTYWQRLRDLAPITGHWPVLGWGRSWLDNVPEYRSRVESGSTAEILAESERVDLVRWQQERIGEELELLKEDAAEYGLEEPRDPFASVEGDWPEDATPYTGFKTARSNEAREPISPLPIALIPTPISWQVPAYLRFDAGFISPAIHTAMARRWHEQYGAEVIGAFPDLMEMQVSQSPLTREDALELAKEQYNYCNDIVIQGTQTLQALAAGLLGGTAWFFWWD
jgi:uncharacterized protein DUF4253